MNANLLDQEYGFSHNYDLDGPSFSPDLPSCIIEQDAFEPNSLDDDPSGLALAMDLAGGLQGGPGQPDRWDEFDGHRQRRGAPWRWYAPQFMYKYPRSDKSSSICTDTKVNQIPGDHQGLTLDPMLGFLDNFNGPEFMEHAYPFPANPLA